MIRRWWKWHLSVERRHIKHLERELNYWRSQYMHERQRAEVAIDVCRVQHQGMGPVTLPQRADTEADLTRELRDITTQPEFGAIGSEHGI